MTEFYNFASNSPVLTFFLILLTIEFFRMVIRRGYRCIMVTARGWPPEHLDADGDFKIEPKKE